MYLSTYMFMYTDVYTAQHGLYCAFSNDTCTYMYIVVYLVYVYYTCTLYVHVYMYVYCTCTLYVSAVREDKFSKLNATRSF